MNADGATGCRATLEVAVADPRRPPGRTLVAELDRYLGALYPPASCHLLDVDSLARPEARFLIAFAGDEALGCGALRLLEPGVGEIKRMYVRPEARGRGVGAQLLAALEAEARALAVCVLRLETGIRQPEAIQLYEQRGFHRRAAFGEYREDPLCRCYEKLLA